MDGELTNIAISVAETEGLPNPEVHCDVNGSQKGDNYLGIIKRVKVKGSNGKEIDLIFKLAQTDDAVRETLNTRNLFLQEINIYEKVFPSLRSFQEEYKIQEPFDNFPKCFHVRKEAGKELLVLKDLSSDGYRVWNRQIPMDHYHFERMIKTYAKFQATAMAFKILKPEEYGLLRSLVNSSKDLFHNLSETLGIYDQIDTVLSRGDIFDESTEKNYYDKLKELGKDIPTTFKKLIYDDTLQVFGHGDCWCNNMLFHYNASYDNQIPDNMKIIDFQLMNCRPAFLDLSYLIYVHASKEFLEHLDDYLKLYHTCLAQQLSKFNLDVNDVLSFKQLMELWPKFARYALLMGLLARRAMLGDPSEVPNLEEMAVHPEKKSEGFAFKLSREDELREQLRDVFKHAIDRKFL